MDDEKENFQAKIKDVVVAALFSPFVVCMAAGSLPLEDFRVFITQDEYILRAFLNACEELDKLSHVDDKDALNEMEMDLFMCLRSIDSVLRACGVDVANKPNSTQATTKYTDFITATASGNVVGENGPLNFETSSEKTKVAAYTVSAMVPCLNLNAHLAKEMRKVLDANYISRNLYGKWVDNYTSEIFQESVIQFQDLLNQLRALFSNYEDDVAKKVYLDALKLRVEFFPSLEIGQQSVVPFCKMHDPAKDRLVIFSDFDFVCTLVDSAAVIALSTTQFAPKTDQTEPQVLSTDQKLQQEMKAMWEYICKIYTGECGLYTNSIVSYAKAKGHVYYQDLLKTFEQTASFQKEANAKVTEMMALKGINMDDLKWSGENIPLRWGCMNFFQRVVERKAELNADVHIISYCWCGDIIRSVFFSGGLDSINVHSNELAYEDSLTTGEIIRKIESPIEKLQTFKDTLLKSEGTSGKRISVYIGRNVADLLCLLEADIGIVMGKNESLSKICKLIGVSIVSLFSGLVMKQKELNAGTFSWKGRLGVLYEVTAWSEIQAFLLGSC